MSNVAAALKEEITRIARKEIRAETEKLKKSSAQYRSEIAALKRSAVQLERQVARLEKAAVKAAVAAEEEVEQSNFRFSAKGLISTRRRLGLTPTEAGVLLGVSSQTVTNWEAGVKPRQQHLPNLQAFRNMGKREALEVLNQE